MKLNNPEWRNGRYVYVALFLYNFKPRPRCSLSMHAELLVSNWHIAVARSIYSLLVLFAFGLRGTYLLWIRKICFLISPKFNLLYLLALSSNQLHLVPFLLLLGLNPNPRYTFIYMYLYWQLWVLFDRRLVRLIDNHDVICCRRMSTLQI